MLRYLHAEQFIRLGPKPFASGANGEVFGAVWKQSAVTLCSMAPDEPELDVVLKQIRSEFKGSEGLKKMIHEVLPF